MYKIISWLNEVNDDEIRLRRMKNWVFYLNWFIIWSIVLWVFCEVVFFTTSVWWLVILSLVKDLHS